MKKSIFSLTVLLVAALSFTACKKDEKTFEEKVIGGWHSVKVKLNGSDVTNYFMLDLQLEQDKSFDATLKIVTFPTGQPGVTNPKGKWTANDSGQKLDLTYDDSQETETYEVLELTDTEMTVKTKQNNDLIEITFEKL